MIGTQPPQLRLAVIDLALRAGTTCAGSRAAPDPAAGAEGQREPVEVYQRLAAANPATFEPDLAMAQTNLSLRLNNLALRNWR